MTRAKTVKGVWGNLKFLVHYKTWATLAVFFTGVAVGMAVMSI